MFRKNIRLFIAITVSILFTNFAISQPKLEKLTAGEPLSYKGLQSKSPTKNIIKNFHYDNGEISTGIGMANDAYALGTFIEIRKSDFEPYLGETIDKLRIGIDNTKIIKNIIIEVYEDSLNTIPVVNDTVSLDSLKQGWNLFSLKLGYTIKDISNFFIGTTIITTKGGYTQTYDTDPSEYEDLSGHTMLNGNYYGTLYKDLHIEADYNIQAIITDGRAINFADLSIIEIEPSTNDCSLDTNEVLTATIINLGEESFSGEFGLYATINDLELFQQLTPTTIAPNQTKRVNLPPANLSALGTYQLDAKIDVQDSDTTNNQYRTQLFTGDATLRIELVSDDFPEETSWIFYQDEKVIARSPILKSQQLHSWEYCLNSSNCYSLELLDINGDGLNGTDTIDGTFQVFYNDVLVAESPENGDFGYKVRIPGIGTGCYNTNITFIKSNLPRYAISGEVVFGGTITNTGLDTINSFQFQYWVNDVASTVYSVENIELLNGESLNFAHTDAFYFEEEKTYRIKLEVTNPNGVIDDNIEDNIITQNITINNNIVPKIQLIEHFTSSTNQECFSYTPLIDANLANNPDQYSLIRYPVNWPGSGDPYATNETKTRELFYEITALPSVYRNGNFDVSYTQKTFDYYANEKSILSLNVNANYTGSNVEILIDILSVDTLDKGSKCFIAIIENRTSGNIGSNGEAEFYNVHMKMLPTAEGQAIPMLMPFESYSFTESYDMTNSFVEEMDDLSVVVFIQDGSTKEILQSKCMPIELGIQVENLNEKDILLYPNPCSDYICLENLKTDCTIEIRNLLSQIVYKTDVEDNNITINTSNINKGVYLIEIKSLEGKLINIGKFIKY